jgi:hypothetical protein
LYWKWQVPAKWNTWAGGSIVSLGKRRTTCDLCESHESAAIPQLSDQTVATLVTWRQVVIQWWLRHCVLCAVREGSKSRDEETRFRHESREFNSL